MMQNFFNKTFSNLIIVILVLSSCLYPLQVADFKKSDHIELVDFLTGKFDPQKAVEFIRIDQPYANRPMHIRRDAFEAFRRMREAALRDGVKLVIISAFRGFKGQERIWERGYKRVSLSEVDDEARVKRILNYSAPPGLSRHHWGCEMDLNSVTLDYFKTEEGRRTAKWLTQNSKRFGFYLTYNEGRLKGFKSEPWQYSYYPICSEMMSFFQLYVRPVHVDKFRGSHSVDVASILEEYTSSINPEILQRMQLEGKTIVR